MKLPSELHAEYIGGTISSDLNRSSNIINNYKQGQKQSKNLRTKCQNTKQLKEAAYRTLVRPRSNVVQPYGTHGR